MGTWRDPLTGADMEKFSLRENLVNHIEEHRQRLGIPAAEFKICDWGCGRGRSVLRLRELGYAAYGADINSNLIENAREFYAVSGYDSQELLRPIEEDGRTDYPDQHFHFIFSEQVFEHVENLEEVAAELARISRPDAASHHTYPPHKGFVEVHLRMPFVHWFPKNKLRKGYIMLMMLFGLEPDFDTTRGKGFMERAEIYYRGNIDTSFYRHYRTVRRCLERHGFEVEFIANRHKKLRRIPCFELMSTTPVVRSFIDWFLLSFIGVVLATTRKG